MYVYVYIYIYIYMCVCVCMYVCMRNFLKKVFFKNNLNSCFIHIILTIDYIYIYIYYIHQETL